MKKQIKFWKDGIRFECQGSGKCCTSRGGYGYVYLTLYDRQRFARYFRLSTREFTLKYCVRTEGHWHLKNVKEDCEFLRDKQCSVYEARPSQCRTWPFWPANMNARTWRRDVVSFCPGIGKGRLYSAKEISEILDSSKD